MKYQQIGLLSLIYGICTVLNSIYSIIFGNTENITFISLIITFISVGIMSLILVNFKKFVNENLNSNALDNIIQAILIINIGMTFIDIVIYIMGGSIEDALNFNMILLVVFVAVVLGSLFISMSNKLKKIYNKGNLSMYANLIMISGILYITIIGVNIVGLIEGIAYIYLYLIFKDEDKIYMEGKSY